MCGMDARTADTCGFRPRRSAAPWSMLITSSNARPSAPSKEESSHGRHEHDHITPARPGTSTTRSFPRLRTALVADRAPQAALVRANEATAQALTGQRDVDSILEREIAEASAARDRTRSRTSTQLFAKMAGGTYGACESCRSPIPIERLQSNSPCQVLRQLFDIADRLDLPRNDAAAPSTGRNLERRTCPRHRRELLKMEAGSSLLIACLLGCR